MMSANVYSSVNQLKLTIEVG